EGADETAVFGDVFARYDAHPARRIVGCREAQIAALRVLSKERQDLLANGRADAVGHDIAQYDEPVTRENVLPHAGVPCGDGSGIVVREERTDLGEHD